MFLLPPTASSTHFLNHAQKEKSTNPVFTLVVYLPQMSENIGPENQMSIPKTTVTEVLLKGAELIFIY